MVPRRCLWLNSDLRVYVCVCMWLLVAMVDTLWRHLEKLDLTKNTRNHAVFGDVRQLIETKLIRSLYACTSGGVCVIVCIACWLC